MSFNDLASMISYFAEQQEKINRLTAEIDEIDQGITGEFVEAQDQVETAVANAVTVIDDHHTDLAPALREELDGRLPAMRDIKGSRRVELERLISELYDDRAQIEQRDADEVEELSRDNPNLNEREEILKRKLEELQTAVADIEKQMRAAGAGLGWLVNARKISKLRKQHQAQATALYGVQERLSEVRSTWVKRRTEAQETQQQLQEAWRLRTAEIAKLNQELDALSDDFEGTCRRGVIEEWVRATEAFEPTGVAAADTALQELVQWRARVADCEAGVIAVSEIIGLLTGVREGLSRMQESVEGVKKEQDMHSELSTLGIAAPPAFLQFHQIWDALLPTVQDEKRSIAHPKAFADIIRQVIDKNLTNESIEAMFNLAGNTLTEATTQWD